MKTILTTILLCVVCHATQVTADAPVTNAPSQRERGENDAKADLKAGIPRYFYVGQPLSADSELPSILKEDYGLRFVGLGCVPVPPEGECADAYNAAVSKAMAERFGTNWWNDAWQKDTAQRDKQREAKKQGTNKALDPSTQPTSPPATQPMLSGLPSPEDVFVIAVSPHATVLTNYFTPASLLQALPNLLPTDALLPVGDKVWWQSGVIVQRDRTVLFWRTCGDWFIAVDNPTGPTFYAFDKTKTPKPQRAQPISQTNAVAIATTFLATQTWAKDYQKEPSRVVEAGTSWDVYSNTTTGRHDDPTSA